MKRKNLTRNALFTSIISLLLCVSMLVGTTFAWFTDSVTTGMNTIAAGNLDIELYANGDKVTNGSKLFDDVSLWEPGVAVYENLEIKNEGTLALKYQMALNFGHENDLNGHKLSEVLKVAVITKEEGENPFIASGANRADVLAAAKSEPAQGLGALGNFYMTGAMEPGASKKLAVIIFWDPNDNATDNLYNANNGKVTSDGKPLHIEVGVNLQATQQMQEKDSFGNDYDQSSSILPKATVNFLGEKGVVATTSFPNGTDATDYTLDAAFQFLPNETEAEAAASSYRYWHADYVIKADKDVKKDSLAVAGYYSAFCDDYNNGNWVMIPASEDISAGTEIRLVQMLGGGGISVNYEEICKFGNDNVGFQCGAIDLTGTNAGTTITVELRMYETEEPSAANGNSHNVETGKYEVVGKYSYTFPVAETKVSTATELQAALDSGNGNIALASGEYRMPSSATTADITISGTKDTVLDVTKGAYMDKANVTIKGVTIKTSTGYVMDANGNQGSDYAALYTPNVTYINCAFSGPMRVGRDGAKFINCTFNDLGNDYIWTYGNDVSFENCTFNTDGKAILIYSDGGNEVAEVSVKNCTFNSTAPAKAGAIANQSCAAIEIHNYGNGVNLVTSGNTFDSNFSGEWRIKTYETGKPAIIVNGTTYTTIAIDGKIMTIDGEKNVTVL